MPILQDREELERRGELTEYGEGQRDLCRIILNEINKNNEG